MARRKKGKTGRNAYLTDRKLLTDNKSLVVKLAVRRYFLHRYHAGEDRQAGEDRPDVLDCCQGEGKLWRILQREFDLAGYWGVDILARPGRLKVDSVEILARPGWPQNVVDVDTYGSPWKHWFAMLPNVRKPLTVFLTIGQRHEARVHLGREELDAIGLDIDMVRWISGPALLPLVRMATTFCLTAAYNHGLRIVEAREAYEKYMELRTRYIGVRLEPVGDK